VIVLGLRPTPAPYLPTHNQRLLDYVKNGGVLIVQYNTAQYDHNYGPYPYSLPTPRREWWMKSLVLNFWIQRVLF